MDKETNMKEGLKASLQNDADIKCLLTQLYAVCICIWQLGGEISTPCPLLTVQLEALGCIRILAYKSQETWLA